MQSSYVQNSMGPVALGDQFNDLTDSGATLDKQHIASFDFVAYAFKIAEWYTRQWFLMLEPVDYCSAYPIRHMDCMLIIVIGTVISQPGSRHQRSLDEIAN